MKERNKKIFEFFTGLDRSYFIDNEYKDVADYDSPLPIGHDQTISQPSLVFSMTCELELKHDSKVLEIGTGSGYQTAFLAEFSKEVYTIERIKPLYLNARKKLEQLGYKNINYKLGDGSKGWREYAPYDRIIVAAAAGKLPENLINQLSNGGRMVVPIGPIKVQELLLIKKDLDGRITKENLGAVRFVEMKGEYGW